MMNTVTLHNTFSGQSFNGLTMLNVWEVEGQVVSTNV